MKRWFQQIGIYIAVIVIAVIFGGLGWWIPFIIEMALIVSLIIGVAFFMVAFTLKRTTHIKAGHTEEDELRDHVKDAVMWLEAGEIWEQISEDGLKLRGRFLKNEGSHVYALCCHGYTNHRLQDISNQAKRFYDKGYNVFAAHARGHGLSEGDYIGMGCKERRDIVGWIDMIVKMDPDARIFLYGVSMGGATVMTTSGEELPDNVKCAIEDCGYSSIWNEFKRQLGERFGVPVYPTLNLCAVICFFRYGFDFRRYSALRQVKKAKIPMLFIHGDQDRFVPYSMMMPVYRACASEYKKAVTIRGARHAESYRVDPDRYWSEVDAWLEAYL